MFSDRVFQIALFVSLIAHGVLLSRTPNFNFFPSDKKNQKLEISYVKPLPQPQKELKRQAPKNEPFLKLPPKITVDNRTPPPYVDKEGLPNKENRVALREAVFNKPEFNQPDIIAIKKKITLPPIDLDKIDNPSYISYYQIVREKIKRCAYYNYSRTEVGEVYISFVISDDGYLKDVRLVEEKSSANAYLREIALRSVKDASPFPNFPKELNYPRLSFNVVISFEIE